MSWDTMEAREFYTLDEVADILRVDPETLRRGVIRRKRLRHHREGKGGRILVRHRDLLAYIEGMAVEVAPEQEREGA